MSKSEDRPLKNEVNDGSGTGSQTGVSDLFAEPGARLGFISLFGDPTRPGVENSAHRTFGGLHHFRVDETQWVTGPAVDLTEAR